MVLSEPEISSTTPLEQYGYYRTFSHNLGACLEGVPLSACLGVTLKEGKREPDLPEIIYLGLDLIAKFRGCTYIGPKDADSEFLREEGVDTIYINTPKAIGFFHIDPFCSQWGAYQWRGLVIPTKDGNDLFMTNGCHSYYVPNVVSQEREFNVLLKQDVLDELKDLGVLKNRGVFTSLGDLLYLFHNLMVPLIFQVPSYRRFIKENKRDIKVETGDEAIRSLYQQLC